MINGKCHNCDVDTLRGQEKRQSPSGGMKGGGTLSGLKLGWCCEQQQQLRRRLLAIAIIVGGGGGSFASEWLPFTSSLPLVRGDIGELPAYPLSFELMLICFQPSVPSMKRCFPSHHRR